MFEFLFDNIFAFFALVILVYSVLYSLITELSFNEYKSFLKTLLASSLGFVIGVVIVYHISFPYSSCDIEPTVWETFINHGIKYIPVVTMIQASILIKFFRKRTSEPVD
jgi:hypothetical protein